MAISDQLSELHDPYGPEQSDDPYSFWATARMTSPVFYSPVVSAWVVTRYADIEEVLQAPALFASSGLDTIKVHPPQIQRILDEIGPTASALRATDPPDHARRRRPEQSAVSARRVLGLEDKIREHANGLIDAIVGEGACDFYDRFAYPYPVSVIGSLLGFGDEEVARLHSWANCRVRMAWGDNDPDSYVTAARGVVEFHHFVEQQVRARRAESRDDLISEMIAMSEASESPLTDLELVEQVKGLVTAGHETTANWLTLTLFYVLSIPGYWQKLAEEPDTIPTLMEETLRLDSPVKGLWRRALADTEIARVGVKAGDRVFCAIASGNRDTEVFPSADQLEPGRPDGLRHMTFGRGPHTCIGSSLARLEGRIALRTLVERMPDLRLAVDQVHFVPNASLRIPQRLDVTW